MIEVLKAPPFATVQDLGWRTGRAIGLPTGGAMDRRLLGDANRMVGNHPGAAALEWALGPGTLRFEAAGLVCALDDAEVRVDGALQPRGAIEVRPGALVEVLPGRRDRFIYLAVRGGLDVPPMLGSRSTYLPGGLGGFDGRRIRKGDRLPVGGNVRAPARARAAKPVGVGAPEQVVLRVTRGPQWERFSEAARAAFFGGRYTVTPASDRMGYRLQGVEVRPNQTATLPSEPACPGAVQIPDGGQPIVLMPDGPTVGGYPKLAVVIGADLGRLAQCQPGRMVGFREVSLEEARAITG